MEPLDSHSIFLKHASIPKLSCYVYIQTYFSRSKSIFRVQCFGKLAWHYYLKSTIGPRKYIAGGINFYNHKILVRLSKKRTKNLQVDREPGDKRTPE